MHTIPTTTPTRGTKAISATATSQGFAEKISSTFGAPMSERISEYSPAAAGTCADFRAAPLNAGRTNPITLPGRMRGLFDRRGLTITGRAPPDGRAGNHNSAAAGITRVTPPITRLTPPHPTFPLSSRLSTVFLSSLPHVADGHLTAKGPQFIHE